MEVRTRKDEGGTLWFEVYEHGAPAGMYIACSTSRLEAESFIEARQQRQKQAITLAQIGYELDKISAECAGDACRQDAVKAARQIIIRKTLREGDSEVCNQCGCTEFDACLDAGLVPCGWAAPGLCSACANQPPTDGEKP